MDVPETKIRVIAKTNWSQGIVVKRGVGTAMVAEMVSGREAPVGRLLQR